MEVKYVLIFTIILFLSIGCVNATDFENLTCDDGLVHSLSDGNILSTNEFSLNGGSFDDVQSVLNKADDGDTIYLNGEFYSTDNSSIIKIKKSVNLISNSNAVFNGRSQSGILYIYPTSSGTVISGLTFVNGYRVIASAAYVDCQNVTFSNCIFENNTGFWNGGGAVATTYDPVNASGLTVEKCIFRGNTAPVSSGGLAAFSTDYKIIDCVFENNYVTNNMSQSNFGGALVAGSNFEGVTGIVSGCIFKNNYAISDNDEPSNGGAIDLRQIVTLRDCVFEDNFADNGGAISCRGNNTVINCTFTNNFADNGGAVYINETAKFENSRFTANDASSGGAIKVDGNLECYYSEFYNNTASFGGAIHVNGSFECYFSEFVNNTASLGGAIQVLNSTCIINNLNFNDNVANLGAGVYNFGTLNVFESSFKGNVAQFGAGVFNVASLNIVESDFNNNSALNGSAIYNNGTLNILDSSFSNNKANSYSINSSNNAPVKKGKDLIINVTLLVGDNVIDAIYNNGNVTVDGVKPKESSLAVNQEIVVILNNDTYIVKTNDEGIAEFVIDTSDLKPDNYTYFFIHADSKLYTGINDNSTVEILENPTDKNNSNKTKNDLKNDVEIKSKKTKIVKQSVQNYLKNKGYSTLNDFIKDNSPKIPNVNQITDILKNDNGILGYIYNMWRINWPHTYSFEEFLKNGGYAFIPFLIDWKFSLPSLFVSYYTSGKTYEAKIKADGDFWKTLEEQYIHFYGYKSHLGDTWISSILYYTLGIDENGNLSIGDALVIGLSILCGIGEASGLSGILGNRLSKLIKNKEFLNFFSKYGIQIKDAFFDVFNVVSNPFNIFKVVIGRVWKKFAEKGSSLSKGIYSFFYNDARNILDFLNPTTQESIKNNLQTAYSNTLKGLNNKITNSVKRVKNKLAKLVKKVSKKISKLVKHVKTLVKKLKNKINNIVKNIANGIRTVTRRINKLVKQFKNSVKKIQNKISKFVKKVKNTVKKVKTKVNKVVKNIKSKINNFKNKTNNFVKNKVNKLVKKVKTTVKKVKGLVKKIKNKTDKLVKKVKSTVKQVKIKAKTC